MAYDEPPTHQNQPSHILLARMSRALKAVNAEDVDTVLLCALKESGGHRHVNYVDTADAYLRMPNRRALVDHDASLTLEELDERARYTGGEEEMSACLFTQVFAQGAGWSGVASARPLKSRRYRMLRWAGEDYEVEVDGEEEVSTHAHSLPSQIS